MYEDFKSGADPAELHDKLYHGTIARFRDLVSMQHLIAFTRGFVEEELAPASPVESHEGREEDELTLIYAAVRRRFANSLEVKRHWRDVFVDAGLDPGQTARDRLVLRFQPPAPPERKHRRYGIATVHLHRDTWGTNLYAQINWWAPVYPLDPGRTLAFYPHLFDRPLENSSADGGGTPPLQGNAHLTLAVLGAASPPCYSRKAQHETVDPGRTPSDSGAP